jgi:hypothetical protein
MMINFSCEVHSLCHHYTKMYPGIAAMKPAEGREGLTFCEKRGFRGAVPTEQDIVRIGV